MDAAALDASDILFIAILLVQAAVFFLFYDRHGSPAIYRTWYALIIDVFAILSGSLIMMLAIVIHKYPELFNFHIPFAVPFVIFLIGSWQALIHGVKLYLRDLDHRIDL